MTVRPAGRPLRRVFSAARGFPCGGGGRSGNAAYVDCLDVAREVKAARLKDLVRLKNH